MRGVNLIAQRIDNANFFYLFNAHGDVVQRIRSDGNASPEYVYDAFGNQRNVVKTDPNPFRYCGEYYDLETGSYYLRARYYYPRIGQFSREDPARSGLNWYTYCGGNPVALFDPSGLSFTDDMEEYFEEFGNDGKDFLNNFASGNNERFNKFWGDKDITSLLDWLTYGGLSANEARGNAMLNDMNWYTIGNWMTSGGFDMVNSTFNNDKPLSFDHWLNSFGTAAMLYGGYRGIKNVRANAVLPYGKSTPIAKWDSWSNYEKVTVNGRTYAKVGDTLYSRHAVDRMQPSGMRYSSYGRPSGSAIYQAGGVEGRSVAPGYANYVIDHADPIYQARSGNYLYTLGNIQVVTNKYGMVVTIEHVKNVPH